MPRVGKGYVPDVADSRARNIRIEMIAALRGGLRYKYARINIFDLFYAYGMADGNENVRITEYSSVSPKKSALYIKIDAATLIIAHAPFRAMHDAACFYASIFSYFLLKTFDTSSWLATELLNYQCSYQYNLFYRRTISFLK